MRGRDLAMVRKAGKLSQKEVGRRAGISQNAVIDIEKERLVPKSPSMADLAALVGQMRAERQTEAGMVTAVAEGVTG